MFKLRLLPVVIITMAGLFLVKSENIVRPLMRGQAAPTPVMAPARAADRAKLSARIKSMSSNRAWVRRAGSMEWTR